MDKPERKMTSPQYPTTIKPLKFSAQGSHVSHSSKNINLAGQVTCVTGVSLQADEKTFAQVS